MFRLVAAPVLLLALMTAYRPTLEYTPTRASRFPGGAG